MIPRLLLRCVVVLRLFVALAIAQTGAAVAVAAVDTNQKLQLSHDEKAWLADHPEIVLAPASDYYPFEFFDDNGSYRGVAADYFSLVEERLGIRFRIVPIADSGERLAQIASKRVDMIAISTAEKNYDEYMLYTQPHIVMPGVIVAKQEYKNLEMLKGKKLAAVSGTQWEDFIVNSYPDVHLVRVPDMASGLELVSLDAVDALVSDMATTSYYIHREGMTDIGIVGRAGSNLEIRLATRKDWPELNHIMEQALAGITVEEKGRISRQWIHLKQPSLLHSTTLWTVTFIILAAVLFVLASILIWNRSLKRQVSQRTQSLNVELQRRRKAESELQAAHEDLINSHRKLKQTQLHLVHAAKMESVGRLAAGVAHEVKNPLAVISLGLDYVASVLNDKNTYTAVLQDMNDAVRRADSVANGLLDFSREENLNSSASDINSIIDDSLHLVKHELSRNNVSVVKDLCGSLRNVQLDANKMRQVFVNLFINAIQAMKNGGTLCVSTCQTIVKADNTVPGMSKNNFEAGQDIVVAEVCDDGPGIDDKQMAKIFDPFYTTKPVGEGTGLGLSIIRNIVDLHRGAIEVRNRDSGGLSIRIVLPVSME